jgi:glycosyltransferase involved in cell wall biosynthesis
MNTVVFTPALVRGDAVSHDVLSMVDTLRRHGRDARPAARWIKDGIDALTLDQMAEALRAPDDLLIYHHSIGLEEAVDLYERLPCRKIIKYHNVTPPKFFQSINKEVARACQAGIDQLERLLPGASAVWADSDFNGRDLRSRHPAQPYAVLPPFNQVDELIDADPELTAVGLHDDWLTNILVVGRIVPNKNILLAVDAFAEYQARFDRHSRLILVGDVAQNRYCDLVIERIRERRLTRHVAITGKVSQRQLKALFLTAQVLLTTSSHEGFCLPLVEAMGLRTPIVATPTTAIPETAGAAGWFADPNPNAIAHMLNEALTQPLERESRMNLGWELYQHQFHNSMIERKFMRLMATAIPTMSRFYESPS